MTRQVEYVHNKNIQKKYVYRVRWHFRDSGILTQE